MPRRFIALTSLAAGVAITVTVALTTPALAKGTTQASITGPGLARPVTVSVAAESEALPEQGDALSGLADQTGLFTVLFGPNIGEVAVPDQPSRLRTPPAAASTISAGPFTSAGRFREWAASAMSAAAAAIHGARPARPGSRNTPAATPAATVTASERESGMPPRLQRAGQAGSRGNSRIGAGDVAETAASGRDPYGRNEDHDQATKVTKLCFQKSILRVLRAFVA